ncbi:MAG: hypothetical protein KBC06_02110 [Candidatus Pacebacteria bacterium]|nr:hypothetical protein [Candidatus Paceibacterota bacterium]
MDEPKPIKKDTVIAPAVETFTSDMVKVIEDSQGGLIKKIIQEQEKHEVEKNNFSPQSKRNKLFVLVSVILILLSVALLVVIFFQQKKKFMPATNMTIELPKIIFTDKSKLIGVDGLELESLIGSIIYEKNNAEIKTGDMESIYLTENNKIVGLRRFLTLMKSTFVPGGVNLASDNFLLGSTNEETKDLFILIKVKSFLDVFDAMRAWEGKMFSEVHGLFEEEITPDTSVLLTKSFEDGIIENKNARILYDEAGNMVLMYVFADDNSIIISNSRVAVHEAILKLASSKIKK